MEIPELIKLIIASAVGVIVKEFFTWLIRSTKPVGKRLAKFLGTWTVRHFSAISFVVEVFFVMWWFYWFVTVPEADRPVSHSSVRVQVGLGVALVVQIYFAKRALDKWILPWFSQCVIVHSAVWHTAEHKIDVTNYVASQVGRGQFKILATRDTLGEPHHGSLKTLTMEYSLLGMPRKTKSVKEHETIVLD